MDGVQIDADPSGHPWTVTQSNDIYSSNGTSWTYRGKGRDIGIGANGTVWRIEVNPIGTSDYKISKWNGSSWNAAVNGGGVRIDVDPTGLPWVVNSAGDIWFMNDTGNFTQAQGLKGVDIGIGGTLGSVYVVSNEPYSSYGNKKVYHLTGTNTWKLTNGGGVRISVDYTTGKPWVVTYDGTAWASTN
jgi:hypothetical protein